MCAAGLVTGCGGDDGEPEAPAAASPSPTDAERSTPTATEGESATPTAGDSACLDAEQRAVRNIWLWRAVSEVTGAPTGHSTRARNTVTKQTAKVEQRLLEKCGGQVPRPFQRFSDDVQRAVAADRFGNAQLDRVLAAWLRWGSALGTPDAARFEIRALESCRHKFFPRFDASYRIWWKWTETGKAWWVDITFDNRTGKVLDGDLGGAAEVTGMLPDPFGWERGPRPGPGRDATLHWGGSSAEILELQPGTTSVRVAPDIDQDVHTTTDGTFRVVEMTVGLAPRGESSRCSPPVRPMP